ncbi:prepilin-type N-terminal cleavage/methylation domain-containing protein [Candidatus Saccharibacteria bacterium]|nr:prepilin-type N-terminal cleavage/methylation domain-containing protein [Candidatus Saccharibacteria bacterium]
MSLLKKQSGFTIVELLIVIVVIAILAAITIVAYNGIQERAANQQMTTAVRTYYTALQSYGVDNGSLPAFNSCLGAESAYNSQPCYVGAGTYNYNSALENALRPYVSSPPTVPMNSAVNGASVARGIFYYQSGNYIGFLIQGSGDCPSIAGARFMSRAVYGDDIFCRIYLPSV